MGSATILEIIFACVLVTSTVDIHSVGVTGLLRALLRTDSLNAPGLWSATRLVISVAGGLMLIHSIEIAIWELFYLWQGCLPDIESAIYFSGVSYTTLGYGDILLPKPWRMLAPIEAMTGTLMWGLSTGLFIAIVNRQIARWAKSRKALND